MSYRDDRPPHWYHVELFTDCNYFQEISDEVWHDVYREPPLVRIGESRRPARSRRQAAASAYHSLQGRHRAAKLRQLWADIPVQPQWVDEWIAFEDNPRLILRALTPTTRYLRRFRLTCGFQLVNQADAGNSWWFVVRQIRNPHPAPPLLEERHSF